MEYAPHNHTYMSRQNLSDISSYAKHALETLERGAGELPQWVNHLISTTRTHMQDVGHYMREQGKLGRKFGTMHRSDDAPWYGTAGLQPVQGKRFGANHAPWYGTAGLQPVQGRRFAGHQEGHVEKGPAAYMARKNLREIADYADASAQLVQSEAGIFPAWIEHKLSLAAQNMDTVGHYLENESLEGRKYGSREFVPFPGSEGDVAFYYGVADGMGGEHRLERWADFQIQFYEQGWREGNQHHNEPDSQPKRAYYYGMADGLSHNYNTRWEKTPYKDVYDDAFEGIQGRRYGARGGRGGGSRGGGGGRGGARGGPRGGGRSGGGGRPGPRPGRPGAPAMGGRGRHFRRHRHRHPTYNYPAWGYPYHPWWGHLGYYPAPLYVEEEIPVPVVRHVYAHRVKRQLLPEIPDSHAVIGMRGSGFDRVPNTMVISYRIGGGQWRQDNAVILSRDDGGVEIAVPVSAGVISGFALADIGYRINGDLVSLAGTFFQNIPRPWNPFIKRRRFGANINRDLPSMRSGKRLFAATSAKAVTDRVKIRAKSHLPIRLRSSEAQKGANMSMGSEASTGPNMNLHGAPADLPTSVHPGFPGAFPGGGLPPEMTADFDPPPPSGPLAPPSMMQTFPPNRMLEDNRMGLWHRMTEEPSGRRFGVPGHPYGSPGWAGAGGVAQVPLAVARSGGNGPRAAETYGSLGYASMGDGSMDMARRRRG